MKSLKRKKMLVLVSAFVKNDKDSGDFTYDLSLRLNRNFRVMVLAPHESGLKFREIINNLDIRRFVYFYPKKYQKLAYGGGIPYNIKNSFLAKIQAPLFFLFELFTTIRIIQKEKPDVIQSHWLLPQGLVGAICQKYFHVPHIATIHSSEVTMIKKIPFGRNLAEFILTHSKQIISVSHHRFDELKEFVSQKVVKEIEEKTSIIPMGINVNKFRPRDKKKLQKKYSFNSNLIILFIGRLVEVKGCVYLISAFAEVLKKMKNSQLIIIGNGPLEGSLTKLVDKLKISQKVKFTGFIDHEEIADYYNLADMVVFPSIIDKSGYQEGLPVVLLESLANRKIIIATNIPGSKEVIEDDFNGFLVKPKDAKDLAQKILDVFKKRNLKKIKSNALKSAQQFDWENVAKRYSKIIKNTLN